MFVWVSGGGAQPYTEIWLATLKASLKLQGYWVIANELEGKQTTTFLTPLSIIVCSGVVEYYCKLYVIVCAVY